MFIRIFTEIIPVMEGGQQKFMKRIEALVRRYTVDAMSGKVSAFKILPPLLDFSRRILRKSGNQKISQEDLDLFTQIFGDKEVQDLLPDKGSDDQDDDGYEPA